MAVAMQADAREVRHARAGQCRMQPRFHERAALAGQILPLVTHFRRQPRTFRHPFYRSPAIQSAVQRRAVQEAVACTHLMDTGDELPDALAHGRPFVDVVQLGHAAALTAIDGDVKAMAFEERVGHGRIVLGVFLFLEQVGSHQRVPVQRRCQRDLGGRDLVGEAVLFQQLVTVPASGAVELGHAAAAIFQSHQIDAVLEAVERLQAPVAAQADLFQCRQHGVGPQLGKGLGRGVCRGWHCRGGLCIAHHASPTVGLITTTIPQSAAGGEFEGRAPALLPVCSAICLAAALVGGSGRFLG